MSEKQDKLDAIRDLLIKKPFERRWRVRKREQTGYTRYRIIEILLKTKKPLSVSELSFELSKELQSTRNHVRVLFDNKLLCNRPDCFDGQIYFAVCPSCPLKEKCEDKLEFWIKSGLMEHEKLPSEKFLEAQK